MLLKAIPLAEQQELVTDRSLSSTAILYKLMVRFQPGGAGEKQILLQQLTTMEKSSTTKRLQQPSEIGADILVELKKFKQFFQMGFFC